MLSQGETPEVLFLPLFLIYGCLDPDITGNLHEDVALGMLVLYCASRADCQFCAK